MESTFVDVVIVSCIISPEQLCCPYRAVPLLFLLNYESQKYLTMYESEIIIETQKQNEYEAQRSDGE